MNLLEIAQATRGDIAEFRHQMELRFSALDARFPTLKAELEGKLEATLEKGLKEQTRFFFLAWAVLLASVIGLYAQ